MRPADGLLRGGFAALLRHASLQLCQLEVDKLSRIDGTMRGSPANSTVLEFFLEVPGCLRPIRLLFNIGRHALEPVRRRVTPTS